MSSALLAQQYGINNFENATRIADRCQRRGLIIDDMDATTMPLIRDKYIGITHFAPQTAVAKLLLNRGTGYFDIGVCDVKVVRPDGEVGEDPIVLGGVMDDDGQLLAQACTDVDRIFVRVGFNFQQELFGQVIGQEASPIPADDLVIGVIASRCLSALSHRSR